MEEVEGRLYRPGSVLQSEVEAFLEDVDDDVTGVLVLVAELEPESPDVPDVPESPDLLSDDDDDDGESVVVVVVDFDFPLRLSVL